MSRAKTPIATGQVWLSTAAYAPPDSALVVLDDRGEHTSDMWQPRTQHRWTLGGTNIFGERYTIVLCDQGIRHEHQLARGADHDRHHQHWEAHMTTAPGWATHRPGEFTVDGYDRAHNDHTARWVHVHQMPPGARPGLRYGRIDLHAPARQHATTGQPLGRDQVRVHFDEPIWPHTDQQGVWRYTDDLTILPGPPDPDGRRNPAAGATRPLPF